MLIDLISSPKAVAMTSQGNLPPEGHHNLINNLISTKRNGKLSFGYWGEITSFVTPLAGCVCVCVLLQKRQRKREVDRGGQIKEIL